MILYWGDYTHTANEAAVSISRNTEFSEDGLPKTRRDRWDIEGRYHADSQAALISGLSTLVTAYSTHGKDLYLKYDDGTTLHYLLTADCVGGTKVVAGPSFPEGRGAEASTYRTYAISVEGEVELDESPGIIQWQETISWYGGGPMYTFLQVLNGLPQKQLVAQSTPYEAEQSGSAIGYGGYPSPPNPIWYSELEMNPRITRGTPRRKGRGGNVQFVEFPISWSYKYKSIYPFATVNPTLPP